MFRLTRVWKRNYSTGLEVIYKLYIFSFLSGLIGKKIYMSIKFKRLQKQ